MLMLLDMNRIMASSKDLYAPQKLDPSHVLLALGLKHEEAHGSVVRMTL